MNHGGGRLTPKALLDLLRQNNLTGASDTCTGAGQGNDQLGGR